MSTHEHSSNAVSSEEAEDRALLMQSRSTWPKVIGIIGLIYGLLGLTCQTFMQGWVLASDFMPEQMRGGMTFPPVMKVVSGVSLVLLLILSVMLIAGSIGTLRRKRSGPGLVRKWAITRMVLLLLGVVASVALTPAMVEAGRRQHEYFQSLPADQRAWMGQGPFDEKAAYQQQIIMMGAFSVLMGIVPLTFGLFLSRKKIMNEVQAWV